jgi:hypothetical protein
MLSSLLGSIKRKCRDARYVWIWHKTTEEVHAHVLLGSTSEVEADWLAGRWARVMRKYGQVQYRARDCFCKPRRYPRAVLSYILGVNRNHPRWLRPWGDLAGKITAHNFPPR